MKQMLDAARSQAVTGEETRPVPSPPGRPLLGWALDLQKDLLGTYERMMREHGDVVRLVAGAGRLGQEFYLVFHPDGIQRVLASGSRNYSVDLPAYQEIAYYLGNGLTSSEGETWLRHRRIIQPIFTHRRIAAYTDLMAEEAAALVGRLKTAAASGGTVEIHGEMTRYALRVVGRLLFGRALDTIIDLLTRNVPVILSHVQFRALSPVRLPRSFPTPGNRRAGRARRELFAAVDQIIEERSHNSSNSSDSSDGADDLVSLLLDARDPETGEGLSRNEIRDELLIFLVAGHETVASALTAALHLIGGDAAVQEKLRAEVDEVLADRPATADDVRRLTYTTMTIKEALRLYPPSPNIARMSTDADAVAGHAIPAHAMVLIPTWAVHRNPAFWPDPERFDPERFSPEAIAEQHRYAYFPFGGGPRRCIGEHFAMVESVVAVATVVRSLLLDTSPEPLDVVASMTLRPSGEVPCRVVPRTA